MPRTEAGKRLLEREAMNSRSFALITEDAIDAIEVEALTVEVSTLYGYDAGVAAERARIRAAVEVLEPDCHTDDGWYHQDDAPDERCSAIDRNAVLALIDGRTPE